MEFVEVEKIQVGDEQRSHLHTICLGRIRSPELLVFDLVLLDEPSVVSDLFRLHHGDVRGCLRGPLKNDNHHEASGEDEQEEQVKEWGAGERVASERVVVRNK